jgi:hypothetical protein
MNYSLPIVSSLYGVKQIHDKKVNLSLNKEQFEQLLSGFIDG